MSEIPAKFKIGDAVEVVVGRLKGELAEVTEWHPELPCMYGVSLTYDGANVCFTEDELKPHSKFMEFSWATNFNPYRKPFPYKEIDIYRVLQVYDVSDPCLQHSIKKLLCAGQRGYKEMDKDVEEAIQSLQRYQEMREEEK